MCQVHSTKYTVLYLPFVGNTVNNTRKSTGAQLRRLMAMKFFGKAWRHIHENYKKMIRNAWRKTGCLLTTDDALVKPEGIADYAVQALPAD